MGDLVLTALMVIGEDDAAIRVLGQSALVFQLRSAVAAGARRAVLLAAQPSAATLAAAATLRAEGVETVLVATARDAANAVHPDGAVLLLSRTVLPPLARLAELAGSTGNTVLAAPRAPGARHMEIIDAEAMWTGFARLDAALLRRTATMVGDWDVASTLVRVMMQQGAQRLMLSAAEPLVELAPDAASALRLDTAMLDAAQPDPSGWCAVLLVTPLAKHAALLAVRAEVAPKWLSAGAALAAAGGVVSAALGYGALAFGLMLGAIVAERAGDRLRRAARGRGGHSLEPVMRAAAAVIVLLAGLALARFSQQWGYGVLAVALVVTLALSQSLPALAGPARKAAADSGGAALILCCGFILQLPLAAFGLCLLHAVATLALQQRALVNKLRHDQA